MNQKLITKRNKIATTVQFTFPVPLISEEIHQEAEGEAKTAYVMTLLRHGEITSGRAARLLGISRLEAIDLMANLGISVFATQTRAELAGEVTETLAMLERD